MKALTICQPYAHLIAHGDKRVENRTWPTDYRGPLAIHAGKSRKMLSREVAAQYPDMVFGAVVATAMLTDCVSVLDIDDGVYDETHPWLGVHPHVNGPWCWVLDDVRAITPQPISGNLGLWTWQPDPGVRDLDAFGRGLTA